MMHARQESHSVIVAKKPMNNCVYGFAPDDQRLKGRRCDPERMRPGCDAKR
jgi:hypothetical protein